MADTPIAPSSPTPAAAPPRRPPLRRRCGGPCAGSATAWRSTSPRRPSCWPPGASSSTSCSAPPPASATRGWSTPAVRASSPTPARCSCRSRGCAATAATTAHSPTVPHRLPAAFLERDEVLEIARAGAAAGCKEALFTLGDRPEERWPAAREWLEARGYHSTLEYVRACAIAVLEETGLLPHLNPGVMSWEELTRLKPVAPSMGMMLETTATRLWSEQGGPHYGSPDKEPAVRLRTLTDAGRVGVPFTTGILIGIGETRVERAESLFAIRGRRPRARARPGDDRPELPGEAGHRDGERPGRRPRRPRRHDRRRPAGARARRCGCRPRRTSSATSSRSCSAPGIDDWGGVSPVTADHVNPERPWPAIDELAARSRRGRVHAARAAHRLPAVRAGAARRGSTPGCTGTWPRWPTRDRARARGRRRRWAGRGRSRTAGSPPPAGSTSTRRSTPPGRTVDRRGDFASVYGDWDSLREQLAADAAGAPERLDGDVRARARARVVRSRGPARPGAHRRRDGAAPRRRPRARGAGRAADELRRDVVGDDGHLRRQPEHQLLERLLRRLPVLRVRAARARRRRVPAVAGRGRRRGRWRRPRRAPRRCACRAGSTRSCPSPSTPTSSVPCGPPSPACTCTRSRRWRSCPRRPRRACRSRSGSSSCATPGSAPSPARRRRSWTTRSAGCSPRASCRPRSGWRWCPRRTGWASRRARR